MIDLANNLALINNMIGLLGLNDVSFFHNLDTQHRRILLAAGELDLAEGTRSQQGLDAEVGELDNLFDFLFFSFHYN